MTGDLVVVNIGSLSTPGPESGWEVETVADAHVVIQNGFITSVGGGSPPDGLEVLDAQGRCAVPALCDPHTHAVFAGWRADEFVRRLEGVAYKDILASGGGILQTVRTTRDASREELCGLLTERLDVMLSHGVLTCEVKSGYGLNRRDEIKMLEAAAEADSNHPVDVVPTFLGAHAVPPEYSGDPSGYVREVVIPLMRVIAGRGLAEYADVFCEPGVFGIDDARRVLQAASDAGLGLRLHADEIEPAGGTALAAEMGSVAADHLLAAPDDELLSLRDAGVTAVLLPGTAFILGEQYARARWMIDNGISVALGTDFNPGSCPIVDIGLIMTLACLKMGMSPAEVLVAVTRNATRSVGRSDRGVVAPGFRGDLVILEAPEYTHLVYRPGAPLVNRVVRAGVQVYPRTAV